jgi:hypothetical protein
VGLAPEAGAVVRASSRDLELTRQAERIARRVAAEHPDPEARETYRWIAERAAATQRGRPGRAGAEARPEAAPPPQRASER